MVQLSSAPNSPLNLQSIHDQMSRSVPRYTSYPTAPHFVTDITSSDVQCWRQDLAANEPVSLYIHVPFCREICSYCGCHTKASLRDSVIRAYADTLRDEILAAAEDLGRHGKRPVGHIAWGGGTPSILAGLGLDTVVKAIELGFALQDDLEHSMELDPRSVTREMVDELVCIGVNRVSLGVQDFDLTVQEKIGRIQPFAQVQNAVALLRQAGISAINLDLMYGLPGQTRDGLVKSLDLAMRLEPSRIALFGYAHVPWFKSNQKLIDEADLPDTAERLELEAVARARLTEGGFVPVGLDHFAHTDDPMAVALRDGTLKRNFQGYSTDNCQTLIGLGASAISNYPHGYAQNAPNLAAYCRSVFNGDVPVVRGKTIHNDDRARRDIINALMTSLSVDVAKIAAQYGQPICNFTSDLQSLKPFVEAGACTVDGFEVTIDPQASHVTRLIAASFDAYLVRSEAKHSVAV